MIFLALYNVLPEMLSHLLQVIGAPYAKYRDVHILLKSLSFLSIQYIKYAKGLVFQHDSAGP